MQNTPMRFDPITGRESMFYPVEAVAWRISNPNTAWLFNPWSGARRSAVEIGSDVSGKLIDDTVLDPGKAVRLTEAFPLYVLFLNTEVPVPNVIFSGGNDHSSLEVIRVVDEEGGSLDFVSEKIEKEDEDEHVDISVTLSERMFPSGKYEIYCILKDG